MKERNEKIPNPKELEKEIGEFLTKKFGDSVKIVTPLVLSNEEGPDKLKDRPKKKKQIDFNLMPEELVAYLDHYIVKQDNAKAILATKICTHFNRIKHTEASPEDTIDMVGSIKNNVLMLGPTGVGKTYMIKLITKKIGVPFVKGDATKFSETGYVGGDVEDLIRDLVREADGNIELAQYGIIYLDEIDKIASSRNLIGADVSRTGVQRALLKPMEETDVELKVPHDPISMIQEIERFRKSGEREKRTVNTKNILFIMSGTFTDLTSIIQKRMSHQPIGFGSQVKSSQKRYDILKHVKTEDLTEFGFESEFVGRLPVRAVFERLTEDDLFAILKNPNNPIILGKKLDFAAYGIDVKFDKPALSILAKHAFEENTGARGLVSAVEQALLVFEKKLPSTIIKRFPIMPSAIEDPGNTLKNFLSSSDENRWEDSFKQIAKEEKEYVKQYVTMNRKTLGAKHNLTLSPARINIVSAYYCKHVTDIENAIKTVRFYYDEVKKVEGHFFNKQDINIVMEDDAIDFIIEQLINTSTTFEQLYKKLLTDFGHGMKLIQEKTGKNSFFLTKEALLSPEAFLNNLIKDEFNASQKQFIEGKEKPGK